MHQPLETEERLLRAAKELWHEGGFTAITTRGVALRAGVNEVTLFRHFGSKDALIGAVVDHVTEAIDLRALVRGQPGQGLEEDLRDRALVYLEHALPVADVLLLSLVTAARDKKTHPWHAAFATRVREALTVHLTALADAGRVPPGPFEDIARHFYGSLFAHVLTAHVREPEPAEVVAASIARTYALAILGRPGPAEGPSHEPPAAPEETPLGEGEDSRVEHP